MKDTVNLIRITEMAQACGICANTLRNWDRAGRLRPKFRSAGRHRYYHPDQVGQAQEWVGLHDTLFVVQPPRDPKSELTALGVAANRGWRPEIWPTRINESKSEWRERLARRLASGRYRRVVCLGGRSAFVRDLRALCKWFKLRLLTRGDLKPGRGANV